MIGLRTELARVGIRGRLAQRIVRELEDHLRCDPGADLGGPREIAERFAEELRVPRTRRATYAGIGALALAAVALGASSKGVSVAGGWPDAFGVRGAIVAVDGLLIVLAGQVAFVAGVLAIWRVLRRPSDPDELRLVQRRLGFALAAGAVVTAGQALQSVALHPLLPAWWFALALPAAVVPALVLGAAAHGLREAVALTPRVEPRPRVFPWRLVIAIGVGAALLITVGSAYTEDSWAEGISRGVLEAVAFAVCFAVFGRRLGIRL